MTYDDNRVDMATSPRPLVHFTAETGWINDPHGVTFRDGVFHLFHQYVPDSMVWASSCHWAHATSPDLLTWQRHGVAIAPGDGDDGIWTGSLVADGPGGPAGDGARILYTSVVEPDIALGRVRLARPRDASWDSWEKGPVVVEPPDDLDLTAFRDPFVIREDHGWRMFVGAATRGGDAVALTYTSADLETWAYDGVAASRSSRVTEPLWMGALWECPQIVEVDGHRAMISSVWEADVLHYAGYGIGGADSYRDGRFVPTDWGRLSFGESYYAPSFFRDDRERPCLLFWMRGVQDEQARWAGCLSVPHVLSVQEGRLVAEPHPRVRAARRAPLAAGDPARAFDLEWTPAAGGDSLTLADGRGETARIVVADAQVSLESPGSVTAVMPWTGGQLRVVVDGPVVEIASTDGLLGGPIAPTDRFLAPDGACQAWALAD